MEDVTENLGLDTSLDYRVREKDELIEHLDHLLERYLRTIDRYEKVNKELSKQLSSVRARVFIFK
jgi:hypothetical protein